MTCNRIKYKGNQPLIHAEVGNGKEIFLKSKIHRVRICSQKPRVNLDLIVVFTRVFNNDAIFFIRSFNLHFSKKLK